MIISYLCIVNRKDGMNAQGSKNLFSGLTKFPPCPERKNEVANGGKKLTNQQNLKTKIKQTSHVL